MRKRKYIVLDTFWIFFRMFPQTHYHKESFKETRNQKEQFRHYSFCLQLNMFSTKFSCFFPTLKELWNFFEKIGVQTNTFNPRKLCLQQLWISKIRRTYSMMTAGEHIGLLAKTCKKFNSSAHIASVKKQLFYFFPKNPKFIIFFLILRNWFFKEHGPFIPFRAIFLHIFRESIRKQIKQCDSISPFFL